MVELPSDLPVPLADVETAQRIAEAARTGRPVDRSPTLEQLLAAFGADPGTGPGTRVRVERALALAGVAVSPPLADAVEGSRVFLTPGRGPRKRRRARALILGLLVLAVVIGGVTAAALTFADDDGDDRASSLPAGTTSTSSATSVPTTTSPAASTSTSAATSGTTGTTDTTAAAAVAEAEKERAAEEKRDAAAERKAARQRREKAAADRRRAEARRRVVVSVTPREPTYLCAEDGRGRVLYEGTLSRKRIFRAPTVRLNVGASSALVKVRGNVFALRGSPAGVVARAGDRRPQALASGQRPSC
ncbi:hypothetical protein DSM112329_02667 [Paraconexibacter sp. AEG42_29]|uniref:DUF4115 domain-containing protein n=1 Tax=Paraconexibacter sp. AEG42_29 TaxID=2997339 RepID=A0AAU7AVY8_9ACTN